MTQPEKPRDRPAYAAVDPKDGTVRLRATRKTKPRAETPSNPAAKDADHAPA